MLHCAYFVTTWYSSDPRKSFLLSAVPLKRRSKSRISWAEWAGMDSVSQLKQDGHPNPNHALMSVFCVSARYVFAAPVLWSSLKSWWPACPRCHWSPLRRAPFVSFLRHLRRHLLPAWWLSRVSSPCPQSLTSAAETLCRKSKKKTTFRDARNKK